MTEWKHTKILPYFCPYCGASRGMLLLINRLDPDNATQHGVICSCCNGVGPADPDPEMAVRKFNTRCLDTYLKDVIDTLGDLVIEGETPFPVFQERFKMVVKAYKRLPDMYKHTCHVSGRVSNKG